MKKLILSTLLAAVAAFAHSAPYELRITQRNDTDTTSFVRNAAPPVSPSTSSILLYDGFTTLPKLGLIGAGLSWDGTTLSATAAAQVNSDWNAVSGAAQILNKPALFSGSYGDLSGVPSTFTPAAHTHAASDITSGVLADARIPSLAISKTTGLQAALDGKYGTPTGSTAQYVRGDGSLATLPTAAPPNFGAPAARSLAVSTSYQATDPSRAAVIYPSFACQNATTVLAASGCTVQVRMGTGTLTCSTGTVYYTQSLTVALGVLITQNSTNPVPIFLPIGGSFIICPTVGTFTVNAVEQSL